MKSLAFARSPSNMRGRAPVVQDWAPPPPAKKPPGKGFPGPPPPPPGFPPPGPPGFPPGFPPNGPGPGPKFALGLGWKENALVIAVAIWVDVIVGCVVFIGDDFNRWGISRDRNSESFSSEESVDWCDLLDGDGGVGGITGGSNATESRSIHSLGHSKSGSLAILLRCTSSLVMALCSSMSFLLFPRWNFPVPSSIRRSCRNPKLLWVSE